MQEACRKIKAELGDDAVIFSTRTLQAPSPSPYRARRTWVEVTAAVDRVPKDARRSRNGSAVRAGEAQPRAHREAAAMLHPGDRDCGPPSGRGLWLPGGIKADVQQRMQQSGFSEEIAWFLIGALSAQADGGMQPEQLFRMIAQRVEAFVPVCSAIDLEPGRKKAVALIGPTGVGKTTTIAKIAAQYRYGCNASVKIISMDTYRIGAVDQLRTYASIMDIPFEVACDDQELAAQLTAGDDCDLLLIDTSGRNYLDEATAGKTRRWIEHNQALEIHMLLSATSSEDVLRATLGRFNSAGLDRLIITKVDETPRQGHLFAVLSEAGIPVSYVTTGQKVPEDIRPATKELLADMLMNGYAA
jgi:flagellar biosynthesis protein FlhF